jgi:hypothetical protein
VVRELPVDAPSRCRDPDHTQATNAAAAGSDGLENREAFADAAGERDDLLAFVAVERLLPGGDRVVAAAGGFEHFGEVAVGVSLA